jgi:hypothetical protein
VTVERRAFVFADYAQFCIRDADAHDAAMRAGAAIDPNRAPGGWTKDASRLHRIGLEPHSISVGTARIDVVEILLRTHETPPHLLPHAEHVVEADLDVTTGRVCIVGCLEAPTPEQEMSLAPGCYRVRVSYLPSAAAADADPDVVGEHFLYLIDLWAAADPAALTVIKQGPSAWAL